MPNPIKILKNNTASIVFITDTGISVPASGSYTIPHQEYLLFAASSDVIIYVSDLAVDPSTSTLTVNDGADDLSISDGIDLLKGIFKRTIVTGNPSGNEAEVTSDQRLQTEGAVWGVDSLAAPRRANTKVRSDGLTALCTDATVVVESTFGADASPDSYFKIVDTGGAGTTWTIDVAATTNDPSTPDRDAPAFQKIFTVQAGEVGDEMKFRDRIISELNLDSAFRQSAFLKAQPATDRGIVHIYSEKFSASGEFWERPNSGDFSVTVGGTPGDGVVVVGFDNLISRAKPVSIFRDLDSPHRLGSFSIFGNVNVQAKDLADLFVQYATDDGTPIPERGGTGSNNLLVDGSITPQTFYVPASQTTDLFIQSMILHVQASSIKFGQFGGKSTALVNGCEVEIKSDNIVTTFHRIFTTEDFKNRWAALSGTVAGWTIDTQPSLHDATAIVSFENPFILKVAGTFGVGNDDYIKITIYDDLTSGNSKFDMLVRGFEKEP